MASPVIFAVPTEVELAPAPIPAHWVIDGDPRAYATKLTTSADGTCGVFVWSCTPGRFRWHYVVDETLHIISGEVFVTDEKGRGRRLGPGDVAIFPAGSSSVWHVTKDIKKLAMCRHTIPRPIGFAVRAWKKIFAILGGPAEDGDALERSETVGAAKRIAAR